MRTMGNFMLGAQRKHKPKKCKGCGRPVGVTVGNSGYCKKCIKKAREEVK